MGQRLFHLGADIDGPHTWRQCDTAQYIWSFHTEGIDLAHPSVCWMGPHKTLLLEFPLPEAVAAVGYSLFGPSHVVARVIFLLFFLGAVLFFYGIVQQVSTRRVAQFATLIFLALPLSFFYSRAIHIDFTALFFAFGMTWFFLKGIKNAQWSSIGIGVLFAIPSFLIKAPYVFYLALPLLGWTLQHKKLRFALKTLPLLLIPVILFGLWTRHAHLTNAQLPDWDFIPGYHKFDNRAGWYFGPLAQRWVGELWGLLWDRFLFEVCGILGILFTMGGILLGRKTRGYSFIVLWGVGSLVYLLIFFNLNTIHNYYQIPFLAPVALFMGLFLDRLFTVVSNGSRGAAAFLVGTCLLAVIGMNLQYAEAEYYKVIEPQIRLGETIQANTPEDALVVVSWGGLDSHCPNVLYRARRYGWSIPDRDLSPYLCSQLAEEGADYLSIIQYSPPEGAMQTYTQNLGGEEVFRVEEDGLSIFLYPLSTPTLP